jgi:hypothetical protein
MRIRARLQRLEKTVVIDRGCRACRERRGQTTLVCRNRLADGTISEPEQMPIPCGQCGDIPEHVINIVIGVVTTREQLEMEPSSC